MTRGWQRDGACRWQYIDIETGEIAGEVVDWLGEWRAFVGGKRVELTADDRAVRVPPAAQAKRVVMRALGDVLADDTEGRWMEP